MRLYRGMRKRKYMEFIGGKRKYRNLLIASKLKPGDLVHTCEGVNLPIRNIYPEGERAIYDFEIETVTGSCHSWMHCCTYPLPTKFRIEEYLKGWATDTSGWCLDTVRIGKALLAGEQLLDERGVPNSRYYEIKNESPSLPTVG